MSILLVGPAIVFGFILTMVSGWLLLYAVIATMERSTKSGR